MNEIEVTSGDFTKNMVMEAGRIRKFLGIEFEVSNRLTTDGSGLRRIPLYTKSGMSFCTWDGGIKTDVRERGDLSGMPWQCYVQATMGAVRRESEKVVEIKCNEA